jgi:transposase
LSSLLHRNSHRPTTKDEGHEDFVIPYTTAFRNRMVARLVGPHAISATALGAETGLAQATLSRWLRQASRLRPTMPLDDDKKLVKKQPQEWTPEEKLKIVLEAAGLSEGELGVYLRGKGIHEAVLEEWREQALAGLRGTEVASKQQTESREVRELKRELKRKDKALAETAALIVLKKKAQEIWGAEDDTTDPKSDE